jgi:type IV secretory pathway ATPase VirB11/archaellum biosynthesis ATPase
MSKKIVQLVTCHEHRCSQCLSSSTSGCNNIVDIREVHPSLKIILIEYSKGVVHLDSGEGILPLSPPWDSHGWKSVYLGQNIEIFETGDILDVYFVGCYLSVIKKVDDRTLHSYFPYISTSLESDLLVRLSEKFSQSDKVQINNRLELSRRLDEIKEIVSIEISKSIPEIVFSTITRIAEIIAQQSTVIGVLIPLILDDEVEEIYVDRPDTLLRSESNQHLDRRNPSLKTDIQLFHIPLRFSASIPPLTPDGFHMQVRRAKQIPYSIRNLIENGTLSVGAAAILILAINSRMNITITGEPGVGKTTLLNALDMTTPQKWRKIYIEDAIESRKYEHQHQVRIKVSPVDEMLTFFDKATEIVKSLHRSPDYLVLGEIQTSEHSGALFQSLSAGLRSIQTCHSESASGLLTRWKTSHGISGSSLALMDLIVTLERPVPGESLRRVREIVEIKREVKNGITDFAGINKLFDIRDPKLRIEFVEDGAFSLSSSNAGSMEPVTAYNEFVKVLKELIISGSDNDLDTLGELLWSAGHPMRFTTCS